MSHGMLIIPPDEGIIQSAIGAKQENNDNINPSTIELQQPVQYQQSHQGTPKVDSCKNQGRRGYNLDANRTESVKRASYQLDGTANSSFDEMVVDSPGDRETLLVVLDAANIGYFYGNGVFDANGIVFALDYFSILNIETKAFIPSAFFRAKPRDGSKGNGLMETEELAILNELVGSFSLSVVPSGDNDDLYIIKYAKENNGFIISNDFFTDHIRNIGNHSSKQSMFHWIRENRCSYTFVDKAFMPNPASKLALCINNRHATSVISHELAELTSKSEAEASLARAQMESLDVLTKAIDKVFALRRAQELRHLLLARAGLYIEALPEFFSPLE